MNRLLTPDQVFVIAAAALPGADVMLLDERSGYDITQDVAWNMRLIVRAFGKERICYLGMVDLALDSEGLCAQIRKGWPELEQPRDWFEGCRYPPGTSVADEIDEVAKQGERVSVSPQWLREIVNRAWWLGKED